MKTAFALGLAALSLVACRDVAGIQPIAFDDSGTGACNGGTPTLLFSSTQAYDQLLVQGGFVFAEVTQSGIDRCATTGCTSPTNILTASAQDAFEASAASATAIDYTLQTTAADGGTGGTVHTMDLDGKNDVVSLSTSLAPSWIVMSGARVFWVDDEFDYTSNGDTVNCLGCAAQSTPWITGLPGGIYGMIADANDVYVLADAASLTDEVILGCSIQTACGNAPRTVIGAVDEATTAAQLASDGTNVYLARNNHEDVVRVDGTGGTLQLLTSQDVVAITVDAAAGNLYYATSTGVVGRVKTDGSDNTQLACNQDTVTALAVDSQNIYFLAGATTSKIYKMPK